MPPHPQKNWPPCPQKIWPLQFFNAPSNFSFWGSFFPRIVFFSTISPAHAINSRKKTQKVKSIFPASKNSRKKRCQKTKVFFYFSDIYTGPKNLSTAHAKNLPPTSSKKLTPASSKNWLPHPQKVKHLLIVHTSTPSSSNTTIRPAPISKRRFSLLVSQGPLSRKIWPKHLCYFQ